MTVLDAEDVPVELEVGDMLDVDGFPPGEDAHLREAALDGKVEVVGRQLGDPSRYPPRRSTAARREGGYRP